MAQFTHTDTERLTSPKPSGCTVPQIEQALDRILVSAPFRNSQQAQRLLRYIVERSIAHEEHLLRERVIGAAGFGRPADYDTGGDPVVRIRVSEVRKRLAQYYQSLARDLPDLTIEIPSGSYRALFRLRGETTAAPAIELDRLGHLEHVASFLSAEITEPAMRDPLTEELPRSLPPLDAHTAAPRLRSIRRWVATLCLLLIAVVLAAGAWWWHTRPNAALVTFWRPWVSSSRPVLISIGSNAVYRFTDDVTGAYQREHHLEAHGDEFFLPLAADQVIRGKDLIPAYNSFVALGDVAAASAVVGTLATQRQTYQERFPEDISFVELRNSPSVLIGGFNNPMTIELTRRLPFVLRGGSEIDDTVHGRRWILNASKDSHDTQDYAIITRLVQRTGDAPVLSIAGIGEYGTLAAANFITNPARLSELAKKLPRHWADHNLQVVLHLGVVDFRPISVEVIATQSW